MAWEIEITTGAKKQLEKVGQADAKRIRSFLVNRLSPLQDPRSVGAALRGSRLGTYWRYRVGDYRIVCDIKDDRVVVVVVQIGHRSDVYS